MRSMLTREQLLSDRPDREKLAAIANLMGVTLPDGGAS